MKKIKLTSEQKNRFDFDTIRIVAISDTHRFHNRVELPEGDLLIHCGDMCGRGKITEILDFNFWLNFVADKFDRVLLTAGNHDWALYLDHAMAKDVLLGDTKNVTYLEHEAYQYKGINLFGSPWTPEFCGWAFMTPIGPKTKHLWSQVPNDTDIMFTHGPERNVLDLTHYDKENAGCPDLAEKIAEVKPFLHFFGHIHETYGILEKDYMYSVNCSTCTLRYEPTNPPIVLDLIREDDYLYINILDQ